MERGMAYSSAQPLQGDAIGHSVSSTPAKGKSFYRPELDALRFCCFLLVFVHHVSSREGNPLVVAFADAGAFGVQVFFLLSAFLITELLLRERKRTSTVNIKAFYLRRILRIWPLYFSFFALCWVLGHLHLKAMQPIPGKMTLFYLLLAGNWYLVLYGVPANPMNVLWSISVEEQFYLVWPWLTRSRGAAAINLLGAVLIPTSYLSIALLAHRGLNPDTQLWANTLVQMQFFAIGGLLALWVNAHKPELSRVGRIGGLGLTLAAWWLAAWLCRLKREDNSITPSHACLGYLLVALGAVSLFLVFYGLRIGSGPFARAAIYLGKISFGLYAFHFLALAISLGIVHRLAPNAPERPLGVLPALVITIALAAASYRFLEAPALRLKERFTAVESRPV